MELRSKLIMPTGLCLRCKVHIATLSKYFILETFTLMRYNQEVLPTKDMKPIEVSSNLYL